MSTVKKRTPLNTKTVKEKNTKDTVQEAFELVQKDKINRENAAIQEYQKVVQAIQEKYGVEISFQQPSLKFEAKN